eukprot:CAMPEP_0172397772 /NCGR_PEP_ID=MMETSP1061-20121228/32805_1 /TAXON_ID=37318 /ORGANISM="Pseudo-nitzschia pungens, Strain cf. pungens" /LENGTH=114 /DNA_ID=CAMNT_0013130065 /DNA_START=25 /DNA_END=365 /DNA_ORIENTATION=-
MESATCSSKGEQWTIDNDPSESLEEDDSKTTKAKAKANTASKTKTKSKSKSKSNAKTNTDTDTDTKSKAGSVLELTKDLMQHNTSEHDMANPATADAKQTNPDPTTTEPSEQDT